MKYLFFVCLVLLSTLGAVAQTRSVTNADLSKYTRERENEERKYLENYVRLGLPSPAEIARRRTRSAIEYREYADQIRSRDAEIERIVAQQRTQRTNYVPQVVFIAGNSEYRDSGYFYSGGGYFPQRFRQPYSQPGYYAGGQFWPTGPATPPRPLFVSPRR